MFKTTAAGISALLQRGANCATQCRSALPELGMGACVSSGQLGKQVGAGEVMDSLFDWLGG